MDSEKRERAGQIFADASELEPDAAERYVAEQCGTDRELLQEVRSLLKAADGADVFFAEIAQRIGIAAALDSAESPASRGVPKWGAAGDTFGPYTLLSPLGEGGGGSVWRAQRSDGRFDAQVAIKILANNPRLQATAERLRTEAQYLASMSHPHIARLLDAGVDEQGRAYLVLELIEGQRIDRYCNEHRLGLRDRVRLFTDVLGAVSHAHAHLVVHRDIKPSNVLVANDGSVKLLDFGIARLIREGATPSTQPATIDGRVALTPEYAAPEQLLGRPVTTATDVYSLGILLYELLGDRNPRGESPLTSFAALVEASTRDPPMASTIAINASARGTTEVGLRRALRGDLDNILRKALAPEPAARYSTAHDFATDLGRYLSGEPVSAMPPTLGYRARKFVARHRGGVVSSLLALIALISALGIALQQMIEARQQRDAAEYQRQRVEASNEFYSLLLEEQGSAAQPLTVLELLDRGADLLRTQFGDQQPFMGRVRFDLSRRYASLPERSRELEMLALAEESAKRSGDDELHASVLCAKAVSKLELDRAAAEPVAAEAEQVFTALSRPDAETRFYCLRMRARMMEGRGDRAGSTAMLLAGLRDYAGSKGVSAHHRALLLTDIGHMYYKDSRFKDSLQFVDETLAVLEGAGRGRTQTYAKIEANRAAILAAAGEFAESMVTRERVIKRLEEAGWADRRGLMANLVNYSLGLVRLHRADEAVSVLNQVRADAESNSDALYVGFAELFLASARLELEELDTAEKHILAAKEVLSGSPGLWEQQLFLVDMLRAGIARKRGQYDEARETLQARLREAGYPGASGSSPNVGLLLEVMGRIELEAQNFDLAERYFNEALPVREAQARDPDRSAYVGAVLVLRARALSGQGEREAAIADLVRAVVALGNGLGADNRETVEAKQLLASHRATLP
ncbi:MAG: protein kinase [Steroidobacteraceae bacterium]